MPKIPRAVRRTGAEQEAPTIQQAPRAAVHEERGLQAIGEALVGVGQTVGDIQAAQARHKLKLATSEAITVSSQIKSASTDLLIAAKQLKGSDAAKYGNPEYNRDSDEIFKRFTQNMDEGMKAIVLQKVTQSNNANKKELAAHQVKETENGARISLENDLDASKKEAVTSPGDMQRIQGEYILNAKAQEGTLGTEETESIIIEGTDAIAESGSG
jgi:hypothetical protein